jgi:HSP20 family protein
MADKEQKVTVDMENRAQQKPPAEAARPQRGLSALAQLERDMQRMFDSFAGRRWMRPWEWDMPELPLAFGEGTPKIDVIDRDDEIVVRAELPGVDKQDIDVSLGDGTVTIKATAHKEITEEKGEYFRREISSGEISRTVALPCAVNGDKAQATFSSGVLQLTLPKEDRARRKQISIQ